MRMQWRLMLVGACAIALVVVLVLVVGGDQPTASPRASAPFAPTSSQPSTLPAPAPVAAPTDPKERLAALRYLTHVPESKVAVLDDATGSHSYFAKVGDDILGARVDTITPATVTLVHPTLGTTTLRLRDPGELAATVQRPFGARAGQVPVVVAPGVDEVQLAKDRADAEAYAKTKPTGTGGGGGGGHGKGSARPPTEGTGRGRARNRANQ